MQDDMVSPRTLITAFVGLALIAALVGVLVVTLDPGSSSSPNRSASHSANPTSQKPPTPRVAPPLSPGQATPPSGQVDWTPAVKLVGAMLTDGTDLVAVLTEPTPSSTGFEAACSRLARESRLQAPAGSGGSQSASLQAVETDHAALVHDCEAAVNDAKSNVSSSTAIADGQRIGTDLVALRWDADNFYADIGDSGGDQSSDASGLSEWTLAREIGFQQSDFPSGTVGLPDQPGGPDHTTPVPASTPCSPVHSQPFVADYDSQTYDASGLGNDFVSSEVLIMPPADAKAALQGISAPGYDTTCFQPSYDNYVQNLTPTSSCGSFTFLGSSISELPDAGFPQGTVAYRYVANQSCTADGQSGTWYIDLISAQVGSAFIQGIFNANGTPAPTPIEQGAMNAMAKRAAALQSRST